MALLAEDVLTALDSIKKRPRGLEADRLAEALSERPEVADMIRSICRSGGLEVKDDEGPAPSGDDLKRRLDDALTALRQSEIQIQDIESTYSDLVKVLTMLADDPARSDLHQELRVLKQNLNGKPSVSKLEGSSKALKNLINLTDHPGVAEQIDAGPESILDNIRDILIILVKDIASLEDEQIRKSADKIVVRVRKELTLDDFKPHLDDIHELIFRVKELIRNEKKATYQFTRDVIQRLQITEKALLASLGESEDQITSEEAEFARQVAGDIKGIEEALTLDGLPLDEIKNRILTKIDAIRLRLQKKRARGPVAAQKGPAGKGAGRKATQGHPSPGTRSLPSAARPCSRTWKSSAMNP